MKKRITSLLLTLAMLLSLLPAMGVTASAAEGDAYYPQGGIQTYQDFSTLLASQVTREIKLLKDIEYTLGSEDEEIEVMYSQRLDLNGHKITIDASKRALFANLIHLRRGYFTLYDSKGDGEIAIKFAPDSREHSIIKIDPKYENAPPTFTMNGGTLTRLNPQDAGFYWASNGCISDNYSHLPWTTERPQITINGGTINCPYDWDRSEYSKNVQKSMLNSVEYMPTALLLRYSELTVNGGTFNGIVWTEELTPRKEDTEPRVSLNGGVFNYPFAVIGLPKNVTQIVIDGARFQDGFYVGESKTIYSFHAKNDPPLLLKSGVFDSHGKNPKLAIYNATAKYFTNSAIMVNERVYTSENIGSLVGTSYDDFYLQLNPKSPIKIIRDAWGVIDVTLDGKPINYAKDSWKEPVVECSNDEEHILTYRWRDLSPEMKAAGYRYNARFTRTQSGVPGSDDQPYPENLWDKNADGTFYWSWILERGKTPKIYGIDLILNLQKKDASGNYQNLGIYSNEHIVRLWLKEAPLLPPISGLVTYSSGTHATVDPSIGGAVYGQPINFSVSKLPQGLASSDLKYQWQRCIERGGQPNKYEWHDIEGETTSQYTPTEVDMDRDLNETNTTIRARITADGYYGELTSQPLRVEKAPNDILPSPPSLRISEPYDSITVVNPSPEQEYYLSTSPQEPTSWSGAKHGTDEIIFKNLSPNQLYYVFTRRLGTFTHMQGEKFNYSTCYLGENTHWQSFTMTPIQNMKVGEVQEVELSPIPEDANNFTGVQHWYTSHPSAVEIYSDEGLTKKITSPDGADVACNKVWIKAIQPANFVSISAESQVGQHELRRAYRSINIADENGDYLVSYVSVRNVPTVAPGDTVTADVITDPAEASGDAIEWENSGSTPEGLDASKLKIETLEGGKKIRITADEDAACGTYTYVPTEGSIITNTFSPFSVTVGEPEIPLSSITPTQKTLNLQRNAKAPLTAKKTPANASGDVEWESQNPDIATVDPETGEVTARQSGEATIRAKCNGLYADFLVLVNHQHDYGEWISATADLHIRYCNSCEEYEQAAHTWKWVVDTPATSTTAGKKHEECTVCGAKRNENTEIPLDLNKTSGSGSTSTYERVYDIKVNSTKNGSVTASRKTACKGDSITLTAVPDKGYALDTIQVVDRKNNQIKLTEKDGKYTFTMPESDVTVSAAFKAAAPASENPFTDVPSGAYYEDAVIWAVKKDITSGTTATTFSPDGSCTRAQAVTFLWRAAGSPEPKSAAMPFADVPAGSYFEKAVLWAVENGITKGTSDTTFTPDASCTRAQIVTFLWRANGSHAVSGNSAFSDVAADAYYAAAVAWAEKNGVTGGIGGGLFGSDNTCTRAQIVTFLHRAMK